MEQKNDLYNYGLYIYQNDKYFKFSIDSILLAEFVKFKKGDKILDLCTGNAPIPLILSTKEDNIKIDAIELQKDIYDLAKKSVKINNLEDVINIINEDIKTVKLNNKYNIITCNPPYFKLEKNSLINHSEIKSIARHEIKTTLFDIIDIANKFIDKNGKFYMVHKPIRLLETIEYLEKFKFGIRKLCFIYTSKNKNAEFFLIEAQKNRKNDVKIFYKEISEIKDYKNIFEG